MSKNIPYNSKTLYFDYIQNKVLLQRYYYEFTGSFKMAFLLDCIPLRLSQV